MSQVFDPATSFVPFVLGVGLIVIVVLGAVALWDKYHYDKARQGRLAEREADLDDWLELATIFTAKGSGSPSTPDWNWPPKGESAQFYDQENDPN